MNLPNKLTMLRVLLIPVFVVLLLADFWGKWLDYLALAVFIIASLTDMLDGMIARKYNLITNFGKFMDPLADKLLVCSAMICLLDLGRIPAWVVIVIIAREFIISGFRLVASDKGVVIAAGYIGKAKTVTQMIMIMLMILDIEQIQLITDIVMYIAAILTVVSLVDYIYRNRSVLKEE